MNKISIWVQNQPAPQTGLKVSPDSVEVFQIQEEMSRSHIHVTYEIINRHRVGSVLYKNSFYFEGAQEFT